MTYQDMMLRDLKKGKTVTPLMALKNYGCLRLGDVAFKLRKKDHDVKTTMVEKNGKRYGVYSI